jgi:EAL domain-containing protein (putative c-di-GMP-specific phosphodiesterase class I)/GGDEF domain-containing protein
MTRSNVENLTCAAPKLLGLLLLWLVSLKGITGTLSVEPDSPRQNLSETVRYISSETNTQPRDIVLVPAEQWQSVSGEINLGYTRDPHWFRFTLQNTSSQKLKRLIELEYPLLDYVDLYHLTEDGEPILINSTGDHRPFDSRMYEHKHFVFPVEIPANGASAFLLRVQTGGAMQVPLTLWEESEFNANSRTDLILESIFYGVMLVMAIFNALLYFSFREKAYLYYVMVAIATMLFVMELEGSAFQFLMPQQPVLNEFLFLILVPTSLFTLCLFAREYLDLKNQHPRWNKLFEVFLWACGAAFVLSLILPYHLSTRITISLAVPIAISNLVLGLSLWRNKEKSARLFAAAWIALLVSLLATIFNKAGFIPSSFLSRHGIPIGNALLVLMFSFALIDRFYRERRALDQERRTALEALNQQKEAEAALIHASVHSEVTSLPNRNLFEKALSTASYRSENDTSAVFLLHLQRFDDVNKTLGHMHADELLRQFALRMDNIIMGSPVVLPLQRPDDKPCAVAHIEGVTFAFALCGDSHETLVREASRLTEQLAEPIEFMGLSLELQFIVGSSAMDRDNTDPQNLLRQAFIAFDQRTGNSTPIATYEPEMNPYSPQRLTLMTELRYAINHEGLELFFQPQIHLKSRRVAGFEALIRWNHPERGFIPPDEFIPMAEKTGLIKPLTRWVVHQALSFCNELDKRDCDAKVSVNISAVNLREPGFCEAICNLLADQSVAAQRLVLEVTETAAMVDPVMSLGVLKALQQARVRLSIDDFGTGHSSLSYIRKLPVNEIKIDRSFVMEMDTNQSDATIVRTTINMCHDLGYDVVAEGVENNATQSLLSQLGCDYIQGYHVARPMNTRDALHWLDTSDWETNSRESLPAH